MSGISAREWRLGALGLAALVALAFLPSLDEGYYLSLSLNIVMYVVLCTAWTLFSGPTHYISLATAAFFGVGTYTVALGLDILPFPLLVLLAAIFSGFLAVLVGLMTLRLSGIYFVIFTLGLAELVRQVITWLQTKFGSGIGLYVLTDYREADIYWMLLAVAGLVYLVGWLVGRSRLGFAMKIIGDDETVARHVGIDTARAKVLLFMISGAFIGVVGAILAPRFSYVQPPSAFSPMISFQVVIMALLGGTKRLWGPLLGVIPFTILFDQVTAYFPNHTSLVIGIAFMAIVYLVPTGITGRIEDAVARARAARRRAAHPETVEQQAS